MTRNVGIIIALLLTLLIGGGIYVFLETHEKKQRTINTGFLGEARKNPLYASRLFLKRMGIPTETKNSFQDFTGFPSTDTVILINSKRSTVSPRQTENLINWVKSGGHVIALATHNWVYQRSDDDSDEYYPDNDTGEDDKEEQENNNVSPDPLQAFLGVRTGKKVRYDNLDKSEQSIIDLLEKDDDKSDSNHFKVKLSDVDKELGIMNMWFNPLIIDKETPYKTEIIKLRSSNFMVRQQVEEGLITLVSSLDFIENKHLEKADHAETLWYMVHGLNQPIEKPDAVWLIHNDKIPSLFALLWNNAWMLILSLSFLLIAWILSSSRRFGPLIPKEKEDRRSLNEHISSSGNFYWKHNKRQQLLESSRSAVFQSLVRQYPNWNHLSETEQVELLQKSTQFKADSIQLALFSPNIEQVDEFTKTIRLLEQIRQTN